ncbi:T9SS type A sorting domain-containing protein [Flavihumibacter solisilvae]|nr:T9SS type A sorting domain-containing protein [Flavihumibacter solisilvae]
MRIIFTCFLLLFLSIRGLSQSSLPTVSIPAIKFYPNPAITQITFDFPRDLEENCTFEIYNFLGKKVYELKNITQKATVELSQFYRGIYIFQLRDKTGRIIQSGRFQVAK